MENNPITPITANQRIAIIDILRGWALLGVVLMNYSDYYYLGSGIVKPHADVLGNVISSIGQIFFAGKSWTLLSVLFGYGFSVLMSNVSAKGIHPNTFFARRMFWLFVLAIINSALFFGDILKDYAVMGLLLLPFRKVKAKTAFIISIVILLIVPAVVAFVNSLNKPGGLSLLDPIIPYLLSHNPIKVLWFGLYGTYLYEFVFLNYLISVHVLMLSLFFFGMALQKSNFLLHIVANKKKVNAVMWISLGCTFLVVILLIVSQQMKWTWTAYYAPYYFIMVGTMLFIASLLCWFYARNKWKSFFSAMQVIGKMTLTNYMTQNFLALILFSGMGFGLSVHHRIHYGYYMLFAIAIYVAQVYFSKWWLSKYQYGPIEWVWRQLSYHKRLPLKKIVASDEPPIVQTNIGLGIPGEILNK